MRKAFEKHLCLKKNKMLLFYISNLAVAGVELKNFQKNEDGAGIYVSTELKSALGFTAHLTRSSRLDDQLICRCYPQALFCVMKIKVD